jgi:hypothetical protein
LQASALYSDLYDRSRDVLKYFHLLEVSGFDGVQSAIEAAEMKKSPNLGN